MERLLEFTEHNPLLMAAFLAVLGIFIVTEIMRARRPYREAQPAEATRLINDGAVAVDLRDPEAYRKGHVAGALNYPADRLDARMDEIRKRLKKAKARAVVIYDEHGMGVANAARLLAEAEPEAEIVNLKGGVTAWRRESLPLKQG